MYQRIFNKLVKKGINIEQEIRKEDKIGYY